uniref:Plus3 domain-containing protein n=1 Tax=Kalanchoe fedtschenkoi TaxID=63787 RepID=A0A7N0UG76_KALFE
MAVSLSQSISARITNTGNSMEKRSNILSSAHVNLDNDEVEAAGRNSRSFLGGSARDLDGGSGPCGKAGNSNACNVMPGNSSSIAVPSQEGPSRLHNVSTALFDRRGKSVLKTPEAVTDTLHKLESSAENYIMAESTEPANPSTLRDSCKTRLHCEGIPLKGESVLALTDSNLELQGVEEYLRKGKGKALSDKDVNNQLAYDNNSHGSAGSCTSERLAISGNRKRSLDQQLTVNGKRLKQNMGGDPGSQSFIRQGSFFMSWITNMIKGYSGSDQGEPTSANLPGIISHYELESHNQKPLAHCHEFSGMGFRNLFRSLYCSNNNEGTRKICMNYHNTEGSGDAKHGTMVDVSAAPLTAYRTGDCKKTHLSDEICDQPQSDSVMESPSKRVMNVLPTNSPTNDSKRLSGMKTIACNVSNGMEIVKNGPSSSSIGKWGAHTSKYNESKLASKEKTAQDVGQKTDYLRSLWVTRFRPNISQPASMEDHHVTRMFISNRSLPCSENNGGDCRRNQSIQLQDYGYLDQDIVEARNQIALAPGALEADESSSPPLSMSMPYKISVIMKGIFDALRRLRLSHSDFLRLMTTRISPSHLRGFYLRVRLSNCKNGLGRKGYCVACVHGALTEQAGPRTRLTVTIGSFTGLVESRYISNQDFLEDELVAWWTASAKSGHSLIPSLEELEQKYEERKRWLGSIELGNEISS